MKYVFFKFLCFLIFCFFPITLWATCSSKIILIQDDTLDILGGGGISTGGFEEEGNILNDTLKEATSGSDSSTRESRIHEIYFSQTSPSGGGGPGFNMGNSGSASSFAGNGYSLPAQALLRAIDVCEQGCSNSTIFNSGSSVNQKCAFIYWSNNVVWHKNPAIMKWDIFSFVYLLGSLKASNRFFIDLSFHPQGSLPSSLENISHDLKNLAARHTYNGYDFRLDYAGDYDTPLTEAQIQSIVALILDRFGSSL